MFFFFFMLDCNIGGDTFTCIFYAVFNNHVISCCRLVNYYQTHLCHKFTQLVAAIMLPVYVVVVDSGRHWNLNERRKKALEKKIITTLYSMFFKCYLSPYICHYILPNLLIVSVQQPNLSHPFHLHGYSYNVIGIGRSPDTTVKKINLKHALDLDRRGLLHRQYDLPPQKDTIAVPNNGYVVLRFRADNPGKIV